MIQTKAREIDNDTFNALCATMGALTLSERCKILGISCFYGYKITKLNAAKLFPHLITQWNHLPIKKEVVMIQNQIQLTEDIKMESYYYESIDDYEIIVGFRLNKNHIILEDDEHVVQQLTSGSVSLRQNQKMKLQLEAFRLVNAFTERCKARIIVHFSF